MRKHILYLASGSGRRFGTNKLLYPLQGKPMYLWGLETLQKAAQRDGNCTLMVVSRYKAIREQAHAMGLQAADSPDSEYGISYTIRAGLSALEGVEEGDYLLFAVADQPWLSEEAVERLLNTAGEGVTCACLSYDGVPGNPTLFSASLIPELMALEGDTGGRAVLRRHDCVPVSAPTRKDLEDIDTP